MEILLPCFFLLIFGGAALGQNENNSTTIATTSSSRNSTDTSEQSSQTESSVYMTTQSLNPTVQNVSEITSKSYIHSTQSEPISSTKISNITVTSEKSTEHTISTQTSIVTTRLPISTMTPQKPWVFPVNSPYCIILNMTAKVHFYYFNLALDFELSQNVIVLATASDCEINHNSSHLALRFQETVNSTNSTTGDIIFTFQKDGEKYGLTEVKVKFIYNTIEYNGMANTSTLFNKVSSSNSYRCDADQNVIFPENITLELKNFQYEAFANETSVNFMKEQVCALDDHSSDIVPIAVGIALAALVLVVLLAYLVGRRRNRQRGYQSV